MSKKTLIVTYLPSGERSSTKKLVDAFLAAAKGKTQVEHLDLLKEVPDFFSSESLGAYVTRNYMGQPLAPNRVGQRLHHGILPDELAEGLRAIFARQHAIGLPDRRAGQC